MDNFGEQAFFSRWEMEQFFSDNQVPMEHRTNVCLPPYDEQQNLLSNTHFAPFPSPTSPGEFAVTRRHLPYGDLHTSNSTGSMDFSMALNLGPCQPQWPGSGISDSLTHGAQAPVNPHVQSQHQIPNKLLCGWTRDFESSSVFPSSPNSTSSLPPTVTTSYANAGQYDAWMTHFLGQSLDTCPSPPDADAALSDSGFFRALADYDFPPNACPNPQPSITPTHNAVSSVPSAMLPRGGPICIPARQGRTFECQWLVVNGAACDWVVNADRRSVVEHLQQVHGIKPREDKARQTCLWEGCRTTLNKESIARHILSVHLKERVHCTECGLLFAREDSLKRHLKGGQHKVSSDKSAARQLSRNRAGSR